MDKPAARLVLHERPRGGKKLYFINRFFYPDFSATSQMLTDLACELAGEHDVTVVTSRALYNDPLAQLDRRDEYQGVEILRLNTTRRGRQSLWGRLLDYLSFYVRVLVFLLRHVCRGDLVVPVAKRYSDPSPVPGL